MARLHRQGVIYDDQYGLMEYDSAGGPDEPLGWYLGVCHCDRSLLSRLREAT